MTQMNDAFKQPSNKRDQGGSGGKAPRNGEMTYHWTSSYSGVEYWITISNIHTSMFKFPEK